jgi:oxygen-dependent protoporphyrinogen oxidase
VDDAAVLSEDDGAIVAAVVNELHAIVGFRAQPAFWRIFRWPRSMAQYTVGHAARVAEIQARAAAIPGFQLVGNAYTGIGIPDCIRMGKQAAAAISKALCTV